MLKLSLDLPFFFDVRLYRSGEMMYFINTKLGTWAALPNYYVKKFIDEHRNKSFGDTYSKTYEILAKSNILSDPKLNTPLEPLPIKPLLVKLQTTGKCNLNCRYCFNDLSIRNRTMSRETMHQAVDYAFRHLVAVERGIIFVIYGGEPLVERDLLFDTIRYIRRQSSDAYVGIITNATLLTRDDVLFFKTNNINIIISFDGLPEFQAQNRFGTTELARADKVFNNLLQLRELNYMDRCCVLCTVTREMSARLLEIVLFLQSHGIISLEFLPLRLLGTAHGHDQMSTDIGAFVSSMKSLINAIEDGRIYKIKVRNILRMLLPLLTNQTVKGEIGCHRCSAGRNSIAINYDGSILGCDMIPENISPTIGDVWQGINALDKLDELISPVASNECKKCLWFRYCRGGCPGASASDNGRINSRHQLTCAVNKQLYPFLLEKLATDHGKLRGYFQQNVQ